MKHGFIKIAAATPKILVANSEHNGKQIVELIEKAEMNDVKVLLLPELCLSGYTCGELFLQDILLKSVEKELLKIVSCTLHKDVLVTVGLPLCKDGKLYNVAAVIQNGNILGFVPKTNLPNYCLCSKRYNKLYRQCS